MSNLLARSVGLFTPKIWQQTVRHRGKLNVKLPRPRHEIARYLEEITRPVIIKEFPDPVESCLKAKSKITDTLKFSTKNAIDFEKFLAGYALGLIQKNNVMLIMHKLDVNGEVLRRNKVEFKKLQASIWHFNTLTMNLLIENNPKYINLKPIVSTGLGRNCYLFCNESNLKALLTLLRKMPHFNLFGGLINETLYTRAGVQDYVKLASLEEQRSQICATINLQLALISNTLASPIESLSLSLSQHVKSQETPPKE